MKTYGLQTRLLYAVYKKKWTKYLYVTNIYTWYSMSASYLNMISNAYSNRSGSNTRQLSQDGFIVSSNFLFLLDYLILVIHDMK